LCSALRWAYLNDREEDLYVAEGPEVGTVKAVEEALANLMEAIALYLVKFSPPPASAPFMTTFESAVNAYAHPSFRLRSDPSVAETLQTMS
jgi:hypothetical protein